MPLSRECITKALIGIAHEQAGVQIWCSLDFISAGHLSHILISNTDPDPLKNHKVTKPVFNVGPSSARQRNAI